MLTVGMIRKGVLHKMREYSNSGEVVSTSDNTDYNISVIPLLNEFRMKLATTTNKIKKSFSFFQNMPQNQLGLINWNENKIHQGGVTETFTAYGAKGFSIQVQGRYVIEIYEDDVLLQTITPSDPSIKAYETIKGLTGATTGKVDLKLTSDYRHPYRWVALFEDDFYDASEVPLFEPYVPYEMPSDYFALDKITYSYEARQLSDYAAYKMNYTNDKKVILINYYEKGEFTINYFAYPTMIADASITNIEASDGIDIEVADECFNYLVNAISAVLMRDENAYMSDTFQNQSEIDKAELVGSEEYDSGSQGIISNSNW